MSAKPVASSYLSVEEDRSKETLLEMLKVSTINSDLSGRLRGLSREKNTFKIGCWQLKTLFLSILS